jgi:exopolysaccharide biosynthesis protein
MWPFIVIPVLGIGAYLLISKASAPVPGSGGTRYQSYIAQIQGAYFAYQTSVALDPTTSATASATAKATLGVIQQMAQADQMATTITSSDMNNINAQITGILAKLP